MSGRRQRASDPFTGAGLTLVVGAAPQARRQFLIEPTSNAVAGMSVLITDPSQIAAAGAAGDRRRRRQYRHRDHRQGDA